MRRATSGRCWPTPASTRAISSRRRRQGRERPGWRPTAARVPGRPSEPADVRLVSLPLPDGAAQGLAAVPNDVEAAVSLAIMPVALQAARTGGRTIALPVAARWMALAYDPAHLEESPAPVPP